MTTTTDDLLLITRENEDLRVALQARVAYRGAPGLAPESQCADGARQNSDEHRQETGNGPSRSFKSDTDLRLDDVVICMGRRRDSPTCLMTPGQDSPTVSLTEVVSGDNDGITIH